MYSVRVKSVNLWGSPQQVYTKLPFLKPHNRGAHTGDGLSGSPPVFFEQHRNRTLPPIDKNGPRPLSHRIDQVQAPGPAKLLLADHPFPQFSLR